ncbi:MAG: hypothetical protein QW508_00265 [Conexivisphaerales archaeon]
MADIIKYLQSLGLKFVMRMPNAGITSGDDLMYTNMDTGGARMSKPHSG